MDNKKRSGFPIMLLILIMLISAGVYAEMRLGLISETFGAPVKAFVPEDVTFSYDSGASPIFSRGKDGFLSVTKDGAVFFSFKGETLWGVTFTMQRPNVIKSGENWVILEPMGRTAYVCGQKGLIYIATPEYPILNAAINRINCITLLLRADDGYIIRIYNGEGNATVSKIHTLEGIYPTGAALSDDGYMLAVSYLDTTKAALSSRVLYFYTDSGAERYGADERTPFKAIEKPGSVITKLFYGKNGNLAGISDNEVFITTQRGDEVLSYPLSNRLESCSFDDEAFGFATGSLFANAEDGALSGSAEWYDYDGNKLSEYVSSEVGQISVYDKYVLLKKAGNYILVENNGDEIWTYNAPEDIITVIPIDKKKAVIAKKGLAQVYSYKTPKSGGEAP